MLSLNSKKSVFGFDVRKPKMDIFGMSILQKREMGL
jgi:hypothetical protein